MQLAKIGDLVSMRATTFLLNESYTIADKTTDPNAYNVHRNKGQLPQIVSDHSHNWH